MFCFKHEAASYISLNPIKTRDPGEVSAVHKHTKCTKLMSHSATSRSLSPLLPLPPPPRALMCFSLSCSVRQRITVSFGVSVFPCVPLSGDRLPKSPCNEMLILTLFFFFLFAAQFENIFPLQRVKCSPHRGRDNAKWKSLFMKEWTLKLP